MGRALVNFLLLSNEDGSSDGANTRERSKKQVVRALGPVNVRASPADEVGVARTLAFKAFQGFPFGVSSWSSFGGEFDPGSGRTLAACLRNASRTNPRSNLWVSGERSSNT